MNETASTTFSRLEAMIRECKAVDGAIDATTKLAEDLDFDSLEAIELIIDIEEGFAIDLDMDESEHLGTVGELVALIDRKVAAR